MNAPFITRKESNMKKLLLAFPFTLLCYAAPAAACGPNDHGCIYHNIILPEQERQRQRLMMEYAGPPDCDPASGSCRSNSTPSRSRPLSPEEVRALKEKKKQWEIDNPHGCAPEAENGLRFCWEIFKNSSTNLVFKDRSDRAQGPSFRYDKNGNLFGITLWHNNEMLKDGEASFTHDNTRPPSEGWTAETYRGGRFVNKRPVNATEVEQRFGPWAMALPEPFRSAK